MTINKVKTLGEVLNKFCSDTMEEFVVRVYDANGISQGYIKDADVDVIFNKPSNDEGNYASFKNIDELELTDNKDEALHFRVDGEDLEVKGMYQNRCDFFHDLEFGAFTLESI